MGYRSEVGYAIRFEEKIDWTEQATDEDRKITSKDLFNTFINEAKTNPDTKLCFDEVDGDFKVDEDKLLIKFHADNVKWYDDFSDVDCHNKLLELAEGYVDSQSENPKYGGICLSYGFVRIGEETEDIETRYGGYDGYDLVYPIRSLDFSV